VVVSIAYRVVADPFRVGVDVTSVFPVDPWRRLAHDSGVLLPIRYLVVCLAILPCLLVGSARAQQWSVIDPPGQGIIGLASGGTGAAELSGITWAGGDQFYVVGDNLAVVYPLTLSVDPLTGLITSSSLAMGTSVSAGHDLEGIAYDPTNASVVLSDETGPAIREHALSDGSLLGSITVPPVFASYRPNLSLESLSREPSGGAWWTANEEALSVDGPVSSFTAGTLVRLQKFDAMQQAAGQWAYETDSIDGDFGPPGRDSEVSGVADLVALPNGELLVFERSVGASFFRHRLYEVDFSGATDVSALPALDGAMFTPVGKHLLWSQQSGLSNFEAITLGPELANGVRSVILVSDNGGGLPQSLQALVLLPNTPACAPEPRPGCLDPGKARLIVRSSGGSRDKLMFSWGNGTIADAAAFGVVTSPLGHGFALCIYDTVGGVPQLRIDATIGRGGSWSVAGNGTIQYKNRNGNSSGVTNVKLRARADRSQVQLKAKGIGIGVPSPPPAGTLLQRDPEIVAQFVNRDQPDDCVTAVFTTASRETPSQFSGKR